MKTVTVTISGDQGVGKSTLARILMSALGKCAVVESAEEVPFVGMDYEELEQWAQRLFANVKIVFKTEQSGECCRLPCQALRNDFEELKSERDHFMKLAEQK